ncbi:MAG: potassium transporter Kup [Gemmatimonadetes bacterium RBG_16_66_8]|nr:MAG: potassium transporter Kup [Gemmatimonadetes bacterium RBG_16_66_8]
MTAVNEGDQPSGRYLRTLTLGALGVVYGDIGTSPLYALRECFSGSHPIALTPDNVLGVLSLILWSLVLVISVKYLIFVTRADNRGEGGIMALLALVHPRRPTTRGGRRWLLITLGLFGASLLYGDSMITPAISVLSAIEGIEVATPILTPYVVPITLVILVGLFLFQRRGTAGVASVFGPVMLLWFAALAALGLKEIAIEPSVLAAVNPAAAVEFFLRNRLPGFFVLGTVFLVVTGGEALYADMGHFGRRPIRLAWFAFVLPALLLNYYGQGALLLRQPEAAENPFYRLVPGWGLYPLIVLATAATIIASQAVITGAFSLTRQAVQLGYSPRLRIDQTSSEEIGQIYVPAVNWTLMVFTGLLVVGFGSSSRLAGAYGMAVSSDMLITSLLLFVVSREIWGWSLLASTMLTALFATADVAFLSANVVKIPQGGWFALVIAAGVFTVMSTWKRGREILGSRLLEHSVPLRVLLADIAADPPDRVPGTAVFMVRTPEVTPPSLIHNLAHNKVLHEKVVFLSIVTEEVPFIPQRERVKVEALGKGFYAVTAHYGFMQAPNIPFVLDQCRARGLDIVIGAATFFLGRETIIATERPGMARWRERLFARISGNAASATEFFRIPPDQVFEIGVQVEL